MAAKGNGPHLLPEMPRLDGFEDVVTTARGDVQPPRPIRDTKRTVPKPLPMATVAPASVQEEDPVTLFRLEFPFRWDPDKESGSWAARGVALGEGGELFVELRPLGHAFDEAPHAEAMGALVALLQEVEKAMAFVPSEAKPLPVVIEASHWITAITGMRLLDWRKGAYPGLQDDPTWKECDRLMTKFNPKVRWKVYEPVPAFNPQPVRPIALASLMPPAGRKKTA